ncbi:hypothetical protein [Archangium sp.]|uniref:hypothetical protein n=1 Tax=Archangium sp. TaxID=1872627 RepID=UPI00286A251E|nr:hypothetical protein [Archangium sp.]
MTRPTFSELRWPVDDESLEQAQKWEADIATQVLDWTWRGFDQLRDEHLRYIDLQQPLDQLERDLASKHFIQINRLWARETEGFSSINPVPEWPELETRPAPPGRPPAYDFAFVSQENPRFAWPIEAKVVPNPNVLAPYLSDVQKFVTGTAAPLIGEGGMIAYLLSGLPSELMQEIELRLKVTLGTVADFYQRFHRTSLHARAPAPSLRLHHMTMECAPSSRA